MSRIGLNVQSNDTQAINTQLGLIDNRIQNLTNTGLLPDASVISTEKKVFELSDPTCASKSRLSHFITPSAANQLSETYLSLNAKLTGATWTKDDTTIGSWMVRLGKPSGDDFTIFNSAAAANPIAWTLVFRINTTGGNVIDVGTWQATKIGLTYGGTNADLSATGGAKKVLQQLSAGAAITVAQLAVTDLSSPAAFVVWITNTGGTLQHKIVQDQDAASTLPTYVGSLSGASASFSNTPSVGAGVDFTAGGGIDSGATRYFVLNTAALTAGVCTYSCSMAYNDTQSGGGGLDFWPDLVQRSTNVNGTTRNRLAIEFRNRGTGAAQALTTANIPSGATLMVKISGFF